MNDTSCRRQADHKWFWVQLAIALGTGALAAWISYDDFAVYQTLNQPPFAPPAWLFPVAWTLLYVLMAVSSYLVQITRLHTSGGMRAPCGQSIDYVQTQAACPTRRLKLLAYWLYGAQLFFNFFWTLFFFTLQLRLFAFFWLMALLVLVVWMILAFRRINRVAAWLQAPYLLWLVFAAYLNLGAYLLNLP